MKKRVFMSLLALTCLFQTVDARQMKKEVRVDLTQEQKDNLLYLYEEEKMARDVYLKLNDIWSQRVFSNISSSEQSHMDAVESLLVKYNVPASKNEVGVFDNNEIQNLYYELTNKGMNSLVDAFEVGKIIEETDIKDLQEQMDEMTADIIIVYERLLNGSYNHLDAFNRQLQ